jgi:Amidohydrolase
MTSRFARIAGRHPRLNLIIDHMGLTTEIAKNRMIATAIDQSVGLAKYPNVSVKLSSAPTYSEPYPYRDMTIHIRRLVDAYGPRRCHWGKRQGLDHGPRHSGTAELDLTQLIQPTNLTLRRPSAACCAWPSRRMAEGTASLAVVPGSSPGQALRDGAR